MLPELNFYGELLQEPLEFELGNVQDFWYLLYELWCQYIGHRKDDVKHIIQGYKWWQKEGYIIPKRTGNKLVVTMGQPLKDYLDNNGKLN